MTTTQIRERTLRKATCFAEGQGDFSSCGPIATRKRVRPVARVKPDGRVLRVLIHDRDLDTADVLARQVRRWGHTVMWASDGVVTRHMAAARHPDVVLLNLESSLSDGCRVTRQLRRGFGKKACFVIGFTERDDDECRQQCQAAGIDVLFVRPVEPSVVETLLLLECVNVNRQRAQCSEDDQSNRHDA